MRFCAVGTRAYRESACRGTRVVLVALLERVVRACKMGMKRPVAGSPGTFGRLREFMSEPPSILRSM